MMTSEKNPGRSSKREFLLDIATEIVAQHGLAQLTINALVQASDISKAGVIYHFKTRDDLIAALVERIILQFDVMQKNRHQHQLQNPQPALKSSMLDLCNDAFDMPQSQRLFLTNMLAAASLYPQLIGPVQKMYGEVYQQMQQFGADAGKAMVLAAAFDGITLLELLNFHQFSSEQRQLLRQTLEQAIKDLPE